MKRPATREEIRAYYKARGFDVRIRAHGEVEFRSNRDRFPHRRSGIWLSGVQVSDYVISPDGVEVLP